MAKVEVLSRDEARRRRDEILRSVGTDEEPLKERADSYALGASELAAFDKLREVEWVVVPDLQVPTCCAVTAEEGVDPDLKVKATEFAENP